MAKKTGRPPKYETVEEMEPIIEGYFETCDRTGEPYTVTGLVLALGFAERKSLIDQEARSDEFMHTIRKAKTRIEAQRVQRLLECKGNPVGHIFVLKSMHGFEDRAALDLKVAGEAQNMDDSQLDNRIKVLLARHATTAAGNAETLS